MTVTDQNGLSDQVAIPVTVSKAASDMKFIYNSAANVTAPAPSAAPVAYEAWTHGTGTLDVTDFRFGPDSLTLQPKVTVTGETVSAGLVAYKSQPRTNSAASFLRPTTSWQRSDS